MVLIKPKDAEDCMDFIEARHNKIVSGIYKVEIKKDWIRALKESHLMLLAKYCEGTRRTLAASVDTPPSVLMYLSEDSDIWVKEAVAGNFTTPSQVLNELAKSESSEIQRKVVGNPSCPIEALDYLAKSLNSGIRRDVAEHPNTSPETLGLLAKDSFCWDVRLAVAGNRNTPLSVLEDLARDFQKCVAENVSANDPTTSPRELAKLSRDPKPPIRRSVAENPNTPAKVLKVLAKDTDITVRASVASNVKVPSSILQTLLKDPEPIVKQKAEQSLNRLPSP